MKSYQAANIRNIALLGHGGCGKTTLTEAIAYSAKLTNRMGRVEDGNTISDFDKEEIARGVSVGTTIVPIEWEGYKLNFLDTPGYFDFVGEVQSAMKVAGGAIIVLDATSGIEVGTEKSWEYISDSKKPTFIFVNKMDRENANFDKVLTELREKFGKKIAPFQIPLGEHENFIGNVNIAKLVAREYNGKDCKERPIPEELKEQVDVFRELLLESVAESDEALLEKYFAGETFTEEEIQKSLRKGVISGDIIPVLCGSTLKNIGTHTLMDMIRDYSPSPLDMPAKQGKNPYNDEVVSRSLEVDQPFSAQVYKTVVDAYVGKISLMKVISGKLTGDSEVLNANKEEKEKIGPLFLLRGKNQIDVTEAWAGDIVAVAKLQHTNTGDTLCNISDPILYSNIEFDKPQLYLAIEPKAKGDEEKIGSGLQRLSEEDPSFTFERNAETRQTLICGHGELHIKVIINKLKNKFGVDVRLIDPKVPYRETIKGRSDAQGKHKKQSGGHGQYGDVRIRFEPAAGEFEFAEEVVGGSVPRSYIPAVEKGLRDCLVTGVLAGYPVTNIKATLYDGSYHDVDSSEMAFKIAASLAFKKGVEEAKPVLLEPVVKVNVFVPEEYMGDIMGDLNKRRGRILGMEPQPKGAQLVIAEVPQSEMFKYATDLRSMTQARGSFQMEFSRYEEVPQSIAEKVVEAAQADRE
ncbi:translation elongation factor G [Alkaliphilus metalliredigens QYMF]|uniref:Elongation factor G n=1 Tax=Alkaliphilus metalliredigens (strain QYMF) TaxID=293826 RepID=A6TWL9_ALKMQ|nr:elongation factor G [Alkaliphilus metalliredigens]ABR50587.1 translation elongation factor G [Alkaliphilus metalliredigens QYMF]